MRPSMWTSYLVELDPERMVQVFAEHGWHTLELSDEHGHDLLKRGDPLKVGEQFRRYAADYGVSFPQGHFLLATCGCRAGDDAGGSRQVADMAPADEPSFEAVMEEMRRWVDLFHGLDIKAGVLHAGGTGAQAAGWSAERILARRAQALSVVLDRAKRGPTVICLENLFSASGLSTVASLVEVIEAVGSPRHAAICLDTGHAHLSGVDSAAFAREAGDRLKALHIADNLGQADDHMLPYGRGTVQWTEVMRALRSVNYEGLFNFEVPGENRCPQPVRLAKLDYAQHLARYMIEQDGCHP